VRFPAGDVAGPDAQILFVLRRTSRRLYRNRVDHDLRRLVHDLVGDPMEARLLDDHDRLVRDRCHELWEPIQDSVHAPKVPNKTASSIRPPQPKAFRLVAAYLMEKRPRLVAVVVSRRDATRCHLGPRREEVGQGQTDDGHHGIRCASGVAMEQDPAVEAKGYAQRRMLVLMGRAARRPAAYVRSDSIESVKQSLDGSV
jgi:hypothetical protein